MPGPSMICFFEEQPVNISIIMLMKTNMNLRHISIPLSELSISYKALYRPAPDFPESSHTFHAHAL